ncbi:MAG: AAA family ATPase [Calditrichaeota bacterium]|jgi:archaellum biogenesis ATPase FlaH|nr:AAA family ATPase [Calditrichota bacterium]
MIQDSTVKTSSDSNRTLAPTIHSARHLNDDSSVRPQDVISGGLVVPNGITLLHGKAKAGKTFLAMQMGLQIASATSWLGNAIPERKKVLYVQAELPYFPMRDRIKAMLLQYEGASVFDNFLMSEPMKVNICEGKEYEHLCEIITQSKAEVIIIDPLVYFHNRDENSNDAMGLVMSRFRDLVNDTNTSLILVHHDGKGKDLNGGESSRGASAIFGAVDSDIKLNPLPQKGEGVKYQKMECNLRHAASPNPKRLYFIEETLSFSTDHETNDVSKLKMLITKHPAVSKSEFIELVMDSLECGKSKAYGLIKVATDNRSITVSPEGFVSIPDSAFC